MNNNHIYELVRRKIDGLSYISQFIRLKRIGLVYRGLCPFHNEKTPSLTVYPAGHMSNGKNQDYTSFYCFGCGAGGDVADFKKLQQDYETKLEACYALLQELNIITDNDLLINEIIKEQINSIQNYEGNFLKSEEVNLTCSSMCRNYLNFVKDYYEEFYEKEIEVIEKYYKHFDKVFSDGTMKEINHLVEETQIKLQKRIGLLKNNHQS